MNVGINPTRMTFGHTKHEDHPPCEEHKHNQDSSFPCSGGNAYPHRRITSEECGQVRIPTPEHGNEGVAAVPACSSFIY